MQMPLPKGNTALDCCWRVRASHHPRQPLSCGDLPGRGEAAGRRLLSAGTENPFQAELNQGSGIPQG